MAKLAAVLTKEAHDALADPLKELYVEQTNAGVVQWVLDADVESHPGVAGLKSTVAATRLERENAQKELKKWQELGDPVKAREALDKAHELEEQEARKSGEWEKLKTQLVERHAQEKKALQDTLTERDKDIEGLVVDREIIATLGSEDVKGNVTILLPHMRSRVKAVKESGEWKAVVHDGKGQVQVADGAGTPMTIKQLALELRKDPNYAPNFASTARSGSGTQPGAGAGAGGAGGGGGKKQVKKADLAGGMSKEQHEAIAKGELEVID